MENLIFILLANSIGSNIFTWMREHVLLIQLILIGIGVVAVFVIFAAIIYIRLRERRHRDID